MATDKLGVMNMALTLLGDHRLVGLSDDVEARYALDASWDRAVAFVFQAAYWRFALKTATLTHNGALTALPGYSSAFASPATYFRPHALFVLSGARECPIDVRQQGTQFHANVTPIYLRYVDNALIATEASWPETFAKAVAAYLAFDVSSRVSQDPQAPNAMFGIWQQYFGAAEAIEAVPADPWLDAQLSGDFLPASRYILEQGYWKFAVKSATIADSVGVTLENYTYGFSKPADWLKTQAIYLESGTKELPLDVREHGARWSANVDEINVRYLSNEGLTSTLWPDEFRAIVAAYLAARNPVTDEKGQTSTPAWVDMLQVALASNTMPESPWLRHQVSGEYLPAVRYLLEQGFWNFALRSETLADSAGDVFPNFTYGFDKPADWLKTQAIYLPAHGGERPVDVREHGPRWSATVDAITVRYLSTDGFDAATWPDEFRSIVEAYLTARNPVTDKDGNSSVPPWVQMLQSALAGISVPENQWLPAQLDGRFQSSALNILQQGFWRFALKTVTPSTGGTAAPGFSNAYAQPADWIKTQSIFKLSGDRELPVDAREQGATWSANEAIRVRYLSRDSMDATTWPEEFTRVVAAYLGLDMGDGGGAPQSDQSGGKLLVWPRYLEAALNAMAIPVNPWLAAQLDGRFISSALNMLQQGFWRFALKTVTPSSGGTPVSGFSNAYAQPADWLKTQAVFKVSGARELPVDVREQVATWSANEAIKVRYLSKDGLDAADWPEEFTRVVAAYLGIDMGDGGGSPQTDQSGGKMLVWPRYLESALDALAVSESPWLDHQFSGRYLNVVMAALESGYWRFAVKTVEITANVSTPSSGYSYSFTRPTDWLRTFEVYQTASRDGNGIDFREEDGQYHANYSPITVRYVSATLGVDAATWSPSFEDAVLAEMQLRRASESAGVSGAALQALAMNAKTKMRDARSKDDSRERPRVNAPSRFVSGRFGGGWGYNSREQG